MVETERERELREFYQALSGKRAAPLDYPSDRYVPILQASAGKDPILDLYTRLRWAESESVSLLTGFRGNGKSTELRRLRHLLQQDGCRVILVDMVDFLFLSKRVELSDFLLGLMVAVTEQVREESGFDVISRGYWERVGGFLESEVELGDGKLKVGVGSNGAELGFRLKTDVGFKEMIQKALRGHYASLVRQTNRFMAELVAEIRRRSGDPDRKVVLLVDSVEQLRGTGDETELVQQSVVELFSGQSSNLMLQALHVVYTVPPYLLTLAPNAGRMLGGGAVAIWPNVHVRDRAGSPDPAGLDVMERIIEKRYAGWSRFFTRAQLHELAEATGGDIRDFFRLVRESLITLRNSERAAVDDEILRKVKSQLRQELTQIPIDDAVWLARIHSSHETTLQSIDDLPRLVRFLDANLIMNYLNGQPWYDLHPLILDDVQRIAEAEQARRAAEEARA